MRSRGILWMGLVSIAAVGLSYLYLFRSYDEDNPALGYLNYRYRWGRPHEILADSNRDGAIDFRALVSGEGDFSSHALEILEFWEDRDFDGAYELNAAYAHGRIDELRVDTDGDGEYDQVLRGAEAEAQYRGIAAKLTAERN